MQNDESPDLRIIVADDHTMVRQALATVLALQEGWSVVGQAATGREAVQLSRAEQPDVVLMDVRMPLLSGLDAARLIHAERPAINLLMMTSYDDSDLFLESIQAGAVGYIMKDAPVEELCEAIRTVVRGEAYLHPRMARQLVDHTRDAEHDFGTGYASLTEREREIFLGIVHGMTNRDLAEQYVISPSTVQTHRNHLLTKLGLRSTADLVRYAVRIGLIDA